MSTIGNYMKNKSGLSSSNSGFRDDAKNAPVTIEKNDRDITAYDKSIGSVYELELKFVI